MAFLVFLREQSSTNSQIATFWEHAALILQPRDSTHSPPLPPPSPSLLEESCICPWFILKYGLIFSVKCLFYFLSIETTFIFSVKRDLTPCSTTLFMRYSRLNCLNKGCIWNYKEQTNKIPLVTCLLKF